jgi:hypothetical protein
VTRESTRSAYFEIPAFLSKLVTMDSNDKSPSISIADLVDFTLGKREPVTEKEKELQRQIDEIKAKGHIVEIPSDWV